MKKLLLGCSLFFTVLVGYSQNTIAGVWDMNKDNTKIEIKEVKDFITGKAISSDNENVKGKLLLKDVKKEGEEWKGILFAPKMGKWMDAVITRQGNKLTVKVKSGFISKTLEWNKVQ